MASYLLWSKHAIVVPVETRPSAEEIVARIERSLRSNNIRSERLGATRIAFWPTLAITDRNSPLGFISDGEIDVQPFWDGFRVTVRANPRLWVAAVLPLILVAIWLAGWTSFSLALRWGAGLGGIFFGAFVTAFCWFDMVSYFEPLAGKMGAVYAQHPHVQPPTGERSK